MPEEKIQYLIIAHPDYNGGVTFGYFTCGLFYDSIGHLTNKYGIEVTHWQPLPPPPKGEINEK